MSLRRILLCQLPIPPVGPAPVRGNVPLAGGYLKMYAERRGLGGRYRIDILPTPEANMLGDAALVEAILARDPWLVGFTCYLWNIDRTLWLAERLKERRPDLIVLLGGPEITADNAWTISHPAVDFAAIGEGEQTFVDLLQALDRGAAAVAGGPIPELAALAIPGLHCRGMQTAPPFRKPLPNLNEISSPYLEGILDAADEAMLLLETIRGCIYKCKFCYYPKSYDDLYYLSEDLVVANLRHARERGAREVVLLDPTLNQGRNFDKFVELLARENPDRQFTYFGELRAEGIKESTARLLRQANFTEVEIGLQSIDPLAMDLMDRKNNLKAFERGVRALLDVGINVKVDLIIGLPGDTEASIRRGLDYLHDNRFFSSLQVFNLAILPGTAFRHEAKQLGLEFSPRTPYYVMRTPTLEMGVMYDLMAEAEEKFETEFDPYDDPVLNFTPEESWPRATAHKAATAGRATESTIRCWTINADDHSQEDLLAAAPPADRMAQAFTIRLRGVDLDAARTRVATAVRQAVQTNPHGTFQIVVEPTADPTTVTPRLLDALMGAALETTSYLDRFYSVMPGRPKGAKRLIVIIPAEEHDRLDPTWVEEIESFATLATSQGTSVTAAAHL
jgi:radical SAM superfamily enzyme YgiQ (UPF0313 family)